MFVTCRTVLLYMYLYLYVHTPNVLTMITSIYCVWFYAFMDFLFILYLQLLKRRRCIYMKCKYDHGILARTTVSLPIWT